MIWSRTIIFTILTLVFAAPCAAQSAANCFAFLFQGDVVISCGGTHTQITTLGEIDNFAIGEEKSSLGFTTSRLLNHTATTNNVQFTATLIDLKSGAAKRTDGIMGIIATCGTLMDNQPGTGISRRDLVAGTNIPGPYVRFRCSSDRKTIAGIKQNDLYQGSRKIASSVDFDIHDFNISPDGTKIAWFGDQKPLCESSTAGPPVCRDTPQYLTDPVSVNNAGEVLVATGTGQDCFYKNSSWFSDQPFAGGPHFANDECLGIGYWKPGSQSIRMIEPLGRNPQWITPATAELLRAFSKRPN